LRGLQQAFKAALNNLKSVCRSARHRASLGALRFSFL